MKHLIILILPVLILACNQADKKAKESSTIPAADSIPPRGKKDSTPPPPTAIKKNSAYLSAGDSALLNLSRKILTAIRDKDYTKLASFADPASGIRFSPYAFIDAKENVLAYPNQLTSSSWQAKTRKWGIYDGREDPIQMNVNDYFNRFVYPKDFLNARIKSVNESHGGGNSLDNLKEFYPGCDFIEFYFPGFDPKYEGMDFNLLRLVFKKKNNKTYLVAVVHDEWTI